MRTLQIIPNKLDKSILIQPELPSFSLIWLHGLGDSSVGFLDYFQIPQSPVFRGCRVRLLHAPQRRVTINGGSVFNSWYDIRSFAGSGKDEERYNLEEIKDSLAIIDQNVASEVAFWKEQGLKET
jgi:phospholipase/carboxylesterase